MTTDADFKAKVRARMAQTGRTYTAARADLLGQEPPRPDPPDTEQEGAASTERDNARATEPDRFVDRTLRIFFEGPRLRSIPNKRRARVVVLLHLLQRFEVGRTYTEPQVNEILRTAHDDVASLRRYLVEYGYLLRPGGIYSVTETRPDRSPDQAQEVPVDEAAWIASVPRARS